MTTRLTPSGAELGAAIMAHKCTPDGATGVAYACPCGVTFALCCEYCGLPLVVFLRNPLGCAHVEVGLRDNGKLSVRIVGGA